MELTKKILNELQRRLKIGNRRGVHLNAIPANSRYKFDLNRLRHIDKDLPNQFIASLLSEQPLKFRISWKDNVPDLNSLFEEDQAQLVRITKAFENLINQTEAIESEKGINTFGFGFPIIVRRDKVDNKITVAPILIWSLRIKRTKEFNTWEIQRTDDDPIYLNEVLINHLENDSNIKVDQISNEMLDDGLITKDELITVCIDLIKNINTQVPDNLKSVFLEKISNVVSIGDKSHYEKLPVNSTNSFIEFGGLFSIFEVQKQNIINEYENLMDLEGLNIGIEEIEDHYFQPISSVETDPSQQSILHSLENTRNILIQGPPGTGKSQTLTAVLINALENQKKTIVVCEKRTALEVLHNALIEKGLNYHSILIRDIVKDRKNVVDSVRDRVDNSSYRRYRYKYSKETLDSLISKSKDLINSINQKHKKIDEKLLGDNSWTDVVGILLSELKNSESDSTLILENLEFDYNLKELNNYIEIIQKAQSIYSDFKDYERYSFLNSDKLVGDNPYSIETQINESFSDYKRLLDEIIKLEKKYKKEYFKSREEDLSIQLEKFRRINDDITSISIKHTNNEDFYDEKKTAGILYKTLGIFSNVKKTTIQDQERIRQLFKELEIHLLNSNDLHFVKIDSSIERNLVLLRSVNSDVNEIESSFKIKIEDEFLQINLLEFDSQQLSTNSLLELKEVCRKIKIKIQEDSWLNNLPKENNLKTIIEFIENSFILKDKYFKNENDIFSKEFKWYQFYNSLEKNQKELINQLRSSDNWRKSFLIHYLNSMLLNAANIELPTDDNELVELDGALSGLEKEQLKYIKEYWFSKQIDATRDFETRNINLSVENLYNKRSSNRYKRLSLRQIVQYDADLFTTFFPIILTSPDVASNLFKGMNGYFDIVMFDEASQLRLEDNLPAILKGKQIVIAGDEHQMPPSNYFSKVFDGSIEDEDEIDEEDEITIDKDNILLSCESLLDFASELNFEKRHLDFHYRSRHPYLIDFSNYAFYNQRLKPLPNNFDYVPIKFISVNGTFSEHTNEAEAEMVLAIIENNISRLPNGEYPTVGVATFNIAQRNLIKSKILERQKFSRYSDFNDKIRELEENGLFIKNLENIQGDERDVIILSTTYGIGKDGKFAQRFGPINHSKGYKLLNVIITRAKYKVYICSSIPEDVFMNYKEYLITEGSNNKRAVFYAYLAYCKSVSEQNNESRISVLTALSENTPKSSSFNVQNFDQLESPFEEEVYQSLLDEFGEEKLIPQLQFAGFRIDIVFDSKKPNVPKIAIECDGAKYHSSQEAYLYDRHRQKILERHGFVFHRIWSTNWWRNQKRELTKLIEFIKKIETEVTSNHKDYSATSLAFTDDFQSISTYVAKSSQVNIEKDTVIINSVKEKFDSNEDEIIDDLNKIKLNSIVSIRYINTGKDLKIQIVKDANTKEKTDGIQKINSFSPLAVSILGHMEGDLVKIGNLDNYVEILEIKNKIS